MKRLMYLLAILGLFILPWGIGCGESESEDSDAGHTDVTADGSDSNPYLPDSGHTDAATPDSGQAKGQIGDPCLKDEDCDSDDPLGYPPFCMGLEMAEDGETILKGMCSTYCWERYDTGCPEYSLCVLIEDETSSFWCMPTCEEHDECDDYIADGVLRCEKTSEYTLSGKAPAAKVCGPADCKENSDCTAAESFGTGYTCNQAERVCTNSGGNAGAKIGDPCTQNSDCPDGDRVLCLNEQEDGSGYKGGYCSKAWCDFYQQEEDFDYCGPGAACVKFVKDMLWSTYCMKTCGSKTDNNGTIGYYCQDRKTEGYFCYPFGAALGYDENVYIEGICQPEGCASDDDCLLEGGGALPGYTCDMRTAGQSGADAWTGQCRTNVADPSKHKVFQGCATVSETACTRTYSLIEGAWESDVTGCSESSATEYCNCDILNPEMVPEEGGNNSCTGKCANVDHTKCGYDETCGGEWEMWRHDFDAESEAYQGLNKMQGTYGTGGFCETYFTCSAKNDQTFGYRCPKIDANDKIYCNDYGWGFIAFCSVGCATDGADCGYYKGGSQTENRTGFKCYKDQYVPQGICMSDWQYYWWHE